MAAFSRPQVRGEQKPRKVKLEKTHSVSDRPMKNLPRGQ